VPRGSIRNIIERDTLELLGIKEKSAEAQKEDDEQTRGRKSKKDRKEKRKKDKDD
jgi:hypothetical protein